MPTKKRAGFTGFYAELEDELYAALENLAEANERTFRDEHKHAIVRHLAVPPKRPAIVVPELPPATFDTPPGPPPKKRGRPRKPPANGQAAPEPKRKKGASS
jgi:hypothetical protein